VTIPDAGRRGRGAVVRPAGNAGNVVMAVCICRSISLKKRGTGFAEATQPTAVGPDAELMSYTVERSRSLRGRSIADALRLRGRAEVEVVEGASGGAVVCG